jgi:hypothetical protein
MTIADLKPPWGDPQSDATPFPSLPVSTLPGLVWNPSKGTSFGSLWTRFFPSISRLGSATLSRRSVVRHSGLRPAPTTHAPTAKGPDDFATQLVQRYCGRVEYYEPWNEPDGPAFWDGTNTQLLTISQHVAKIVKDPANCGCTDGSCSPNGGVNPNKVMLPPIRLV